MRSDFHSRRFDPRWLLPATDAGLFGDSDEFSRMSDNLSTDYLSGLIRDEAIEQIYSETRRIRKK